MRDVANRQNNNAVVAQPRNNEEPQAPERQQRRRWMANGQHATWFQGIHSMGHSLGSSSSDGPSSSSIKDSCRMVKTFQAYLPECCHRTYSCVHCRAHLANHDELISKSFQGSQGRAYLFNSVVNVGCGPAEERVLLTGLHAVADIYCESCKTTLGWKYEHAFESSQKYKEGKFIIELAHMIKDNGWES
ncbi:protein yippee-like 1 [Daphnia magna]|uniref:Yippee domain-containing protein n=2 Tax=Daphnia magna TaxID=35525 RepID=A0ABR0AJH3_9CRUS|nr:protein yippee-like 1 [Daphnia magna]XP_045032346.1 protein yippee-like 1 [Daphnia magna]XP_045032347.1 protein yippee-like 1 [Daphnia magna]XP_045032348.1 protein yippee-like 1 [Daphnia magna]XP_045032349.1 protein yippee-like 1 [Daphnia magna]XP_045032350.1 protein yippee-like 1 [Daphnia magna]XP_045032351.1 protein yippee-like 1 [Daphnia magna]KAK4025210.1 hypothetical protein OUZ56_014284 [Daphnia magna]